MKKKLLLFILLITTFCFSQNIDIKWSEKFDIARKSEAIKYFHNDNEYFILFRNKSQGNLFLQQYNEDLKLISEKAVNLDLDITKYEIQQLFTTSKGIVLFFSEKMKKDKKQVLYATIIDKDSNTSPIKIIDEIDSYSEDIFGLVKMSPDKSKIVTIKQLSVDKKNKQKIFSFKVYDSKLAKMIYEKSIEVDYDQSVHFKNFEVDKFGNLYFLVKKEKKSKNTEKGESKSFYELYMINHKNKSVNVLEYALPDHEIIDLTLNQFNEDNVLLTGFVLNLAKRKLVDKKNTDNYTFIVNTINPSTLIKKENLVIELGDVYPKKIKKKDRIPYYIVGIVKRDNGSYTIVAEQYIAKVRTTCNKYGCTTYTDYFHNDILSLSLDKNDKLFNLTRVPKFQKNIEMYSSVIPISVGNTSYIIYEDKASLANTLDDGKKRKNPSSRKNNALQMIEIDEQGNSSKKLIYNNKDMVKKDLVNISKAITFGNGKILVIGNNRIGVLHIKN